MSDSHDREAQSDLAVMEANEYKQKRRLERLLDAVDGVQDTADEAWNAYVAGEISQEARNITIQRTVQNAIRESYKLLLDHSREAAAGEEGGRDRYWRGDPQDPLGRVELLGAEVAVIVGLEDFLEAPTFFERTVTRAVSKRNMPDETVTQTVEATMPEEISYRAFLRLKEFLDDVHDMEISFEELDDKLADHKHKTVELPDGASVDDLADSGGFGGNIDSRALGDDD